MTRTGTRPHTWKVQGKENHDQYVCWLQMRAQAQYRREPFELTFEDYQQLWQGYWHSKGRGSSDYCLTRFDSNQPWNLDNCRCIPRIEHLRRQRQARADKKRQKYAEQI